jgi:glutamyl-tRNA synthetase
MEWLGLSPDEGPFRQSEAEARHRALADALYEAGFLYACGCTREEIDARIKGRATPGYDGHCRELGIERSSVTPLRFRVPDEGETVVDDVIRGRVAFPNAAMEDFVAVKSSGHPLFALANAVDDRDMAITHIIRGEDLLPTTPKQVLLWAALDQVDAPVALPVFAHLPMLVNEQRKKLSKRKDPVAVESYRDQGYLPDAFVNYLALLGWSPAGDVEICDRASLIEQFRLEDVQHSPAFFDVAKLTHINGEYIRAMSTDEFVAAAGPWIAPETSAWAPEDVVVPWPAERFDEQIFRAMAPLVQERVATLGEVPAMVDFLFLADPPYDEAAVDKGLRRDARASEILAAAVEAFSTCDFDAASLHQTMIVIGEGLELNLRKTQAPVRVAMTGRSVGPPLFESMEALGRDEVRRRLEAALAIAAG